jgi:hypothetical protein
MPATLAIVPWTDPVTDAAGHDPRSLYAETFWLPTLGPTALLFLRHLAARFDRSPDGVELQVADTSRALGVGHRDGASSPISRTLVRLEQFDLARVDERSHATAVRRVLPPLPARLLRRLPASIQESHARWFEGALADARQAHALEHAQRLALTLVEEGVDLQQIEAVVGATGFHPAVSAHAARWVRERKAPDATSRTA